MKTILIATIFLQTLFIYSQKSLVVSGGNAVGSGTVSYSVGQIITTTNAGSNGSVIQGVQQSIEIFTLVNPELHSLTLKAITYPNPTKDNIVLSLLNHNLTQLQYAVFDVNGKLISKGKVEKETTLINLKNFAVGVYFLKVNQQNKQLKVFKIIKN